MIRVQSRTAVAALGAALAILLMLPAHVLAHERREVGHYTLVVGWVTEPAYVGEKNGLSLTVTDRDTNQPVEGLDQTLRAEILFGGQQRQLELRQVFRQPGAYTADVVPTREGDYRFRISGTINGTAIDETFDSADGKFHGVEPITAIQFPPQPAGGEVAAALQSAERQAAAAQAAAAASQTAGLVGIAVGAIGVLLGGVALARSRRQASEAVQSSRQQATSS